MLKRSLRARHLHNCLQKAPTYRGKVIANRPNERWVVDFIDFSAEPSGEYKYIVMVQDIFSRKLWATAMVEKKASEYIDHMKSMFIDYGKPQEIMQMVNLTFQPSTNS